MRCSGPLGGKGRPGQLPQKSRFEQWPTWLVTAVAALLLLAVQQLLHALTRSPRNTDLPPLPRKKCSPPSGSPSARLTPENVALILAAITALAMLVGAVAALINALHSGDPAAPIICRKVVSCVTTVPDSDALP